jgi:hypothetical protein
MSRRTRVSALLAGTALALLCAPVFADPMIGGVTQKEFTGATGTPPGASQEYLYFNHNVFAGETVSTPASGSTRIEFLDRTEIRVGANSSIVLDHFVYDPGSRTGDVAIKFSKGIFRFVSGDITNKDAVKLNTPTASLTIRGTNFKVYVGGDGSTILQVDKGAVDTAPCNGGKVVRANSGEALKVNKDCSVQAAGLSSVPTDAAVDGGDNGSPSNGSNGTHPGAPASAPSGGGSPSPGGGGPGPGGGGPGPGGGGPSGGHGPNGGASNG